MVHIHIELTLIKYNPQIIYRLLILKDKIIEEKRYDARARTILNDNQNINMSLGSNSISLPLRTPYLLYEEKIKEFINPNHKVLEIGAGTGIHTFSLLNTGAQVTATDISPNSLKVLSTVFKNIAVNKERRGGLKTMVADMENLPFQNKSFDVVASAGSLSYGDSKIVDKEIRRVLKPTGFFICVDSLNNNPIYKFNRYLHYLQGTRSKMTLINMPSMKRLEKLTQLYSAVEVNYFGAISFLTPFMKSIIGIKAAKKVSDKTDNIFRIKKSAFKFVLVAKA